MDAQINGWMDEWVHGWMYTCNGGLDKPEVQALLNPDVQNVLTHAVQCRWSRPGSPAAPGTCEGTLSSHWAGGGASHLVQFPICMEQRHMASHWLWFANTKL